MTPTSTPAPTRRNAATVRRLVLTLALGLIALVILALACGPSAPAGQDGPPEEATPTAASTPTPTPTPVTVDLGPSTGYVQPELLAMLQQHAAGDLTDKKVSIAVGYEEPDENSAAAMNEFITANGGVSEGPYTWRVSLSFIPRIMQRPDVYGIILANTGVGGQSAPTAQPYPKMDETLVDAVRAYELGVPAEQAALYVLLARDDKVVLEVIANDVNAGANIRRWLRTKGVYAPDPSPKLRDESYHTIIGALVPVALILPLSQQPGVAWLNGDSGPAVQEMSMSRAEWGQEERDWVNAVTESYLPPEQRRPTPTPTPTRKSGVSGATVPDPVDAVAVWETDLADKLRRHGVDNWHNGGVKGKGVTVGIIDWGFAGFDDVPGLPDLDIVDDAQDLDGNAFCQNLRQGTWPKESHSLQDNDHRCEPIAPQGIPNRWRQRINHGVNIAELVNDMAPEAELLMAQANSPRQVNLAADWLARKGADVIVHAAGWPYDGPGDGTSPLTTSVKVGRDIDEHSLFRYVPSPLNTVDTLVNSYGIVWINAAANAELYTLFINQYNVVQSGEYRGFVIFNRWC